MSRYWSLLPVLVLVGVPIWSAPSDIVIAIEGLAALFCIGGLLAGTLGLVTVGGVIGTIGYAAAAVTAGGGTDIVGAAVYGLALLTLLDLSEFARRFRGAAVTEAVLRAQVAYWLARAGLIAAVAAALLLCAAALAMLVPGSARAVVAGAGALLAFAGALRAGIGKPER
ncbi:MAG TPA: hypothetical protein VG651_08155 [Stellaceae bacterium]|nr:hypothetical protein [Stellaceae bacterium]